MPDQIKRSHPVPDQIKRSHPVPDQMMRSHPIPLPDDAIASNTRTRSCDHIQCSARSCDRIPCHTRLWVTIQLIADR
ncbi:MULTISPECIES: hypothetical protein [unclassified Moorena]|uniref:hypothetical protein n=1 Tax=unclassified Moorena TaxID=2683338 RepID=UPI001417D1C9|nr:MULTISPECIES: hypothetical protein [unclassified Moorena]NEO15031.1 hypothetical protein [Moorena sp. SIO3E8]